MKRRDLEKHFKLHGCAFSHHGKEHDHWINPKHEADTTVPRHKDIALGTALAICRDLKVPKPKFR